MFPPSHLNARLKLMDESFVQPNGFKRAINEALEKSNDTEKQIMVETLKNLDIDYLPEKADNTKESEPVENAIQKLNNKRKSIIFY